MKIQIINGPNLNLLGMREPNIYGAKSFEDYLKELELRFNQHELSYFQSNHEGELIDQVQSCPNRQDGIVINAGGYTHTSIALADALRAVRLPYIEVHISNVFARENFRQTSFLSGSASGVVSGFGLDGYRLAIEGLVYR